MTIIEELAPRHSGALCQGSLFVSTREEFIAKVFASVDEMSSWRLKGWLSFDPLTLAQYDEKERVEVQFIEGLARSGLSNAMIDRMLSNLEKPYCYDSSTTFFSFVENRWIGLPPAQDPAEVTREYLNELVVNQDWGALRELHNEISQTLETAEDTNE